jgi:hypothetical protein
LDPPPQIIELLAHRRRSPGLNANSTHQYLDRRGIEIHPRAKDRRARFIERRGALVRDASRKIESQIKEEGLAGIPFSSLFADAVFAGNALLSVNGSTPYNAACSRVPRILPSIDQVDAVDEARMPSPGLIRRAHRLREVSVQAMMEGSARARLGRAVEARTTIASQKLDLQNGEEVDFFRQPSTKDASGWFGPATVIDIQRAARGIISIRWQNRILEVQTQNLRSNCYFHIFSERLSCRADSRRQCLGFYQISCRRTASQYHHSGVTYASP